MKKASTDFDESVSTSNYCVGYRYFKLQIRMLKLICIWPLDTDNVIANIAYRFSSFIILFLLFLASIGQIMKIILSKDLNNITSAVDIATLTSSAVYKMGFFIIFSSDYKRLLAIIGDSFLEKPFIENKVKEKQDIGCGDFNFKDRKKSIDMNYWLRNVYLYSGIYIGFAVMTLIMWGLTPVMESLVYPIEENETFYYMLTNVNDSSLARKEFDEYRNYININNFTVNTGGYVKSYDHLLPLNAWIPFNISWSPLFEIVYSLEFITFIYSGLVYIFEDVFLYTVMWLLCGQFEILKESLANLSYSVDTNLNLEKNKEFETGTGNSDNFLAYNESDETNQNKTENGINDRKNVIFEENSVLNNLKNENREDVLYKKLVTCINYHQILIQFLRHYEKLNQSMIIVDFLHAIISLSFALLHTTESSNFIEYTKTIMFVVICIIHQYLNNFFGEYIIQQQLGVSITTYDLKWEDYSIKFQKALHFMVVRSQTPIVINGLKMYFLCYKTFMEFVKTMISYFMVLRQIKHEEIVK